MKTRAKIGQKKGNPAYRTPSFFRTGHSINKIKTSLVGDRSKQKKY